jgi:hypothetical protein
VCLSQYFLDLFDCGCLSNKDVVSLGEYALDQFEVDQAISLRAKGVGLDDSQHNHVAGLEVLASPQLVLKFCQPSLLAGQQFLAEVFANDADDCGEELRILVAVAKGDGGGQHDLAEEFLVLD